MWRVHSNIPLPIGVSVISGTEDIPAAVPFATGTPANNFKLKSSFVINSYYIILWSIGLTYHIVFLLLQVICQRCLRYYDILIFNITKFTTKLVLYIHCYIFYYDNYKEL